MDHHAVDFLGVQANQRPSAIAKVEIASSLNERSASTFGARATGSETVGLARHDSRMEHEAHLQDISDPRIAHGNHILSLIRRPLCQSETDVGPLERNPQRRQVQIPIDHQYWRTGKYLLILNIDEETRMVFHDMSI